MNRADRFAPKPVASSQRVTCMECAARCSTEWCALGDEEVRILNEFRVQNVYRPGQVIFFEGNPCLGLYCIESGVVAIRRTDAAGHMALVRLATAGHTLGYRTFFAGGHYHGTAEALTPARVCFVDRAAVQHLMRREPKLAYRFLQHLAQDLDRAEEDRLHASAMPLRARLAHLLLLLRDEFGTVDDKGRLRIDLPLSRQDMAAMLGARPETITRLVKSLEADGIVVFDGRTAWVDDLDDLLDEVAPYLEGT